MSMQMDAYLKKEQLVPFLSWWGHRKGGGGGGGGAGGSTPKSTRAFPNKKPPVTTNIITQGRSEDEPARGYNIQTIAVTA
jgi:hypothetical protein